MFPTCGHLMSRNMRGSHCMLYRWFLVENREPRFRQLWHKTFPLSSSCVLVTSHVHTLSGNKVDFWYSSPHFQHTRLNVEYHALEFYSNFEKVLISVLFFCCRCFSTTWVFLFFRIFLDVFETCPQFIMC